MKLFSTKTHGVIDYLSVITLLALPRLMGWDRRVTRLLTGAALGTLGYSLLTAYELGAVKTIPMETHLNLDAMQGVLMGTAPFIFLNEDGQVAAALVGIGLFEVTAALTTEPRPHQLEG